MIQARIGGSHVPLVWRIFLLCALLVVLGSALTAIGPSMLAGWRARRVRNEEELGL